MHPKQTREWTNRKLRFEALEVRVQFAADSIPIDSMVGFANHHELHAEEGLFGVVDVATIAVPGEWLAYDLEPSNEWSLQSVEKQPAILLPVKARLNDSHTNEIVTAVLENNATLPQFDSLLGEVDSVFGGSSGSNNLDSITSDWADSTSLIFELESRADIRSEQSRSLLADPFNDIEFSLESATGIDSRVASPSTEAAASRNDVAIVESRLSFDKSSVRLVGDSASESDSKQAVTILASTSNLVSLNQATMIEKKGFSREYVSLELGRYDPRMHKLSAVRSHAPEFLAVETEAETDFELSPLSQMRQTQSTQASRSPQPGSKAAVPFLANSYAALAAASQNPGFIPDGMLAIGDVLVGNYVHGRPAKLDGIEKTFAMHGLFVLDDLANGDFRESAEHVTIMNPQDYADSEPRGGDINRWWAPLVLLAALIHGSVPSQAKTQILRLGRKITKLPLNSKQPS